MDLSKAKHLPTISDENESENRSDQISESENRLDPNASERPSPDGEVSHSTKLFDRFEWTIHDVIANVKSGILYSPEFWSYSTLWRMALINKGASSGCSICLQLWCHPPSPGTRFQARIGLKKPDSGRDVQKVSSETDLSGFLEIHKFQFWSKGALTTSNFKYISNDRLIIFCELYPSGKGKDALLKTTTAMSSYSRLLVKNLSNLLDSGANSDVKLKVGSKVFKAHKAIVCARCPVFSSMFQYDMSETNSGVVEIPDCSADAFAFFLRYIYTGEITAVQVENSDIVRNLYYIADKYNVLELKGFCSEYLMDNLTVDNFCDVVALALLHSESALLTSACEFFTRNVKAIITTPRWQTYLSENPIHANELYIKAIDSQAR